LRTGKEVQVLPRVLERAFDVTASGLYFGYLTDQFTRTTIEELPYGATKPVPIAAFPKPTVAGLAVRRDASELMLGQLEAHVSQLMMMDLR
jgi:hypothetical protein